MEEVTWLKTSHRIDQPAISFSILSKFLNCNSFTAVLVSQRYLRTSDVEAPPFWLSESVFDLFPKGKNLFDDRFLRSEAKLIRPKKLRFQLLFHFNFANGAGSN